MSTTSLRHPLTRALLVLTFTTGVIDAASYLGLGHVFTANMTGNVVLLGFGVAGGSGLPVVSPIVSLVAFLVGATVALSRWRSASLCVLPGSSTASLRSASISKSQKNKGKVLL